MSPRILFLILVTDLPPSIALGMEPGERNILEQPPRPKEEPIARTPKSSISTRINEEIIQYEALCIL